MFHYTIPFQVDSLEFPGQKHKWLLTQLLLKGKNKAHETLLDDLAKSLYLLGRYKKEHTFLLTLMFKNSVITMTLSYFYFCNAKTK